MRKPLTPEQRKAYTAYQRRYEQTAKGKACLKRHRDKRIFLAKNHCLGIASSADDAKAINAYIKARTRAFQRQQSGAETESLSACPVSPQAAI